ncbi:hypothetical protein ASPCAL14214 [Aspergillus calidoustus]|uniref:FAD-binding FR-type domain-containing protein n=1 Tax=Aspergillus calidoustus TaxID=454130 RepID=A0A0U5HAB4_ASPCI|nr:hypothetical protein ASPCAL14214 [Aspergillus calidoustus]
MPPTLELVSSRRLTQGIALHTFQPVNPTDHVQLRPTQHISLEFPKDLDPTAGPRILNDEQRRLCFTPCRVITTKRDDGTAEQSISILSRNGRVTSLLGLPRINGLRAEVLDVGGGFSPDLLGVSSSLGNTIAVAGGTGAGCFLSVTSSDKKLPLSAFSKKVYPYQNRLLWSIRGDDFRLVEYVLENGLIDPQVWIATVFVTAGQEDDGLIAGEISLQAHVGAGYVPQRRRRM